MYGGPRTDYPASWAPPGEARTVIPRDRLTDGSQDAWRARTSDGQLTGPYTQWCYFRVDHIPPTADMTTDATPKKAGEEAVFTLHGSDTDTGSGIVCARWSTNGTPSAGWRCSDEATDAHIVRLTDGTLDIKLKPATWGSQSVYLETMDPRGTSPSLPAWTTTPSRPPHPHPSATSTPTASRTSWSPTRTATCASPAPTRGTPPVRVAWPPPRTLAAGQESSTPTGEA